ncbi:unnamed protein product [Ectocarpus sp. 13 AM-2016]
MPIRSWFPNMVMAMISGPSRSRPAQASFKIQPKMTKWEVKEYLTKIYNVPVKKVMTQNFEGKRKRIMGKRSIVPYKRPNFKKAIVTFESPQWTQNKGPRSLPS